MDPNGLRTHILKDSIRRLSQQAAWYRRQRGRKEKDYVRIANALTEEGEKQLDVLRKRAAEGDESARYVVENRPSFGIQPPLDLPSP